jgi:hypothetical protein
MNKLLLAVVGIAVVFATIDVHAQSESSMASPWNVTSTSTSTSASTSSNPSTPAGMSGWNNSHPGSGMRASAKMVGTSSLSLASSMGGLSLPSSSGGASGGGSSSGLYLTPQGTYQHGMAPGSFASDGSLSTLGALASQSQFSKGTPGVGNSQLSAFNAQMMNMNQGSGQSVIALISGAASKSSNGIASGSVSVKTPRMGFHPIKACTGGGGTAQSCNGAGAR